MDALMKFSPHAIFLQILHFSTFYFSFSHSGVCISTDLSFCSWSECFSSINFFSETGRTNGELQRRNDSTQLLCVAADAECPEWQSSLPPWYSAAHHKVHKLSKQVLRRCSKNKHQPWQTFIISESGVCLQYWDILLFRKLCKICVLFAYDFFLSFQGRHLPCKGQVWHFR